MEDGRPYWAYIAVKPSLYRMFYDLSAARQTLVLGDYGTVIASGFDAEPPADVIEEMRERYGFDEHYAEKIVQEVNRQQAAFLADQEEKRLQEIVSFLKTKAQIGRNAYSHGEKQRTLGVEDQKASSLMTQEEQRLQEIIKAKLSKKQSAPPAEPVV